MTKITVLGEEPKKEIELKKIEFILFLESDNQIKKAECAPKLWDNIILLRKGYNEICLDLMFAYDDGGGSCLYLGHFNDGVV